MTKKIQLNDLENSEVVIADVQKDIEIKDNRIKIKAIVEKKETKITEQKNKLGIVCQKKEIITKKIPVQVQGCMDINSKFIKIIDKNKLMNLICENLNYSYYDFHKYNTTNAFIEEVQKFYPGAYDVSFEEKKDKLSNHELQKGYYYYSKFQIKVVTIDEYYLSKALVKEIEKILKQKLKNLKFEIYNDSLFFGPENLTNYIPIKLIGSFSNNNEVKYLYNLDTFYWDFKENKIKSQYYFNTEKFDLIGFTNTQKELCEIDENDIITPEHYLEKKEININSLPVKTNIKKLALKEYYKEAEKLFQKIYGEDIKKLQELFS